MWRALSSFNLLFSKKKNLFKAQTHILTSKNAFFLLILFEWIRFSSENRKRKKILFFFVFFYLQAKMVEGGYSCNVLCLSRSRYVKEEKQKKTKQKKNGIVYLISFGSLDLPFLFLHFQFLKYIFQRRILFEIHQWIKQMHLKVLLLLLNGQCILLN